MESEHCSPDVVAATTIADNDLRISLFGEGGSRYHVWRTGSKVDTMIPQMLRFSMFNLEVVATLDAVSAWTW